VTELSARDHFGHYFKNVRVVGPSLSKMIAEWVKHHPQDPPSILIPDIYQSISREVPTPMLFHYMFLGFLCAPVPPDVELRGYFEQIARAMVGVAAAWMKAEHVPDAVAAFRRARGQASWRLSKIFSRQQIALIRAGTMIGLADSVKELPFAGRYVLAGLSQIQNPLPFAQGKWIDYIRDGWWP
jgi:hypothetical protein